MKLSCLKKNIKNSRSMLILVAILCTLTSCHKYYLSLTDRIINEQYLASVHVNTPDKRRHAPPKGEMIVVDWRIPSSLLANHPTIQLHLIYRNYTEQVITFPIRYKMGYETWENIDTQYRSNQGILSYSAQIVLEDGRIYKEWRHQLYTKLITFDVFEENNTQIQEIIKENSQ